jgi:carboxypeptidase C (cathepsin A)
MGTALRKTMHRQPHLRVFIAAGYYDLATPYFAAEHTLAQLDLAEASRKHIEMHRYPAGHMMYVHQASLKSLSTDLEGFYETAPTGQGGK